MHIKEWISAFRLRTLPLALSCSVAGSLLAASQEQFNWTTFLLCIATTIFLQVLSNLANDLGDYQHGTDDDTRVGPTRAMQTGIITQRQMKIAILIFITLSLTAGIVLIWNSFRSFNSYLPLVFFFVGILAIIAALKYTYGKNPYGYAGWGDVFVFIFFGIVGVSGTYFLYTGNLNYTILLPSASIGFLSTGVLNMNNIRDIDNDNAKNKITIPVRLGFKRAVKYHNTLITLAFMLGVCFSVIVNSIYSFLWLLCFPLFLLHLLRVNNKKKTAKFDRELKTLALSTFIFSILFGLSQILALWRYKL